MFVDGLGDVRHYFLIECNLSDHEIVFCCFWHEMFRFISIVWSFFRPKKIRKQLIKSIKLQ